MFWFCVCCCVFLYSSRLLIQGDALRPLQPGDCAGGSDDSLELHGVLWSCWKLCVAVCSDLVELCAHPLFLCGGKVFDCSLFKLTDACLVK